MTQHALGQSVDAVHASPTRDVGSTSGAGHASLLDRLDVKGAQSAGGGGGGGWLPKLGGLAAPASASAL